MDTEPSKPQLRLIDTAGRGRMVYLDGELYVHEDVFDKALAAVTRLENAAVIGLVVMLGLAVALGIVVGILVGHFAW